jgi:hypothetical protein
MQRSLDEVRQQSVVSRQPTVVVRTSSNSTAFLRVLGALRGETCPLAKSRAEIAIPTCYAEREAFDHGYHP